MGLRGLLLIGVILLIVVSAVNVLAQGGCVSIFYTISENIPPSYYSYFEFNFQQPGNVALLVSPEITSNVPVKLLVLDLEKNVELASTSSQNELKGIVKADFSTPRKMGLAIMNPSTATAAVSGRFNVTLCGGPALAWSVDRETKTSNTGLGRAAPVGIVDIGVALVNGTFIAYRYDFQGVKALISFSDDFKAHSYNLPEYTTGASVQLNLNLKVVTNNRDIQFYWVQEVLVLDGSEMYVNINIWNITRVRKDSTCILSPLTENTVRGHGSIKWYDGSKGGCAGQVYAYAEPRTTPLGDTTLEVSAEKIGNTITLSFFRDQNLVDYVTILPAGSVTDASFTVEPMLWEWSPIDAELVFSGKSNIYPLALLASGQVILKLSYLRNGAWIPPLAAWSTGGNTYEVSVANAVIQQAGIVKVVPGNPDTHLLWVSLVVIKTPLGDIFSQSLDISGFIRKVIDFQNGTRLVEPQVYVNGKLFNGTKVSPGDVVEIKYTKQHHLRINLPTGVQELWVNDGTKLLSIIPEVIQLNPSERYILTKVYFAGIEVKPDSEVHEPGELVGIYRKQFFITVLSLNTTSFWADENLSLARFVRDEIELGNRTRLVKPRIIYNGSPLDTHEPRVIGPGEYVVAYTRQYLCMVTTLEGSYGIWVDSGSILPLQPPVTCLKGVCFVPVAYMVNNQTVGSQSPLVNSPLNVQILYDATASVDASSLGLPALYATVRLQCDSRTAETSSLLAYKISARISGVSTPNCIVNTTVLPLWPILLASIIIIVISWAFHEKRSK
ncbi:MAG: thermopsin family protease [Infirmifilum sp.]